MRPGRATLVVVVAAATAACRSEQASLGPADSFALFAASAAIGGAGDPLPVRRLHPTAPEAASLAGVLSDGFGSEMLRTVYLAKQFVRDAAVDGRRFPDTGRAVVADALPIVVGADRPTWGRGLAVDRWLRGPENWPGVFWIGLGGSLERDRAIVQTVAGRLAAYALQVAVTGGVFADPAGPASGPLAVGYRQAMEVIAREWRVGKGPQGVVPWDAGTAEQKAVFAAVRENRHVLPPGATTPLGAREQLAHPGVAATVIYRLAQTRALAGRPAPAAFYAPFVTGRVPEGVSPAAVLGPFRNFQAKLLGVWGTAALRGAAPRDIAELVELYGAAFAAERREARRVFLVTTFGATAKSGGVRGHSTDAKAALAELDALLEDVEAGRRGLRSAIPSP